MASKFDTWWQKSKLRSCWQKINQHRGAVVAVAIILVVIINLIIIGYRLNLTGFDGYDKVTREFNPSGQLAKTTIESQPEKTLWDWLGLLAALAIPVVVGFGAAWFTRTQQLRDQRLTSEQHDHDQVLADQRAQTEREISEDNQREAALQAYLDRMSELLLKEHLGELTPEGKLNPAYEKVRKIARVRTLTVLPRLDKHRKRSVLEFLYESELICNNPNIIELNGADLSRASLSRINLKSANLSNTFLGGADLSGAILTSANLNNAQLFGSDLRGAWLEWASLRDADLRSVNLHPAMLTFVDLWHADLESSDLSGADLSNANLIGADLSDTNLSGTYLGNARLGAAKLIYADLSGADLSGADLSGADLSHADITPEQLDTAKSLVGTIKPDWSIHP